MSEDKEEILYNQLYERTKNFGRNEFIKELMRLERENQQLKEQLEEEIGNEFKLKDELRKNRKEYQETYKDVREEIKVYKLQLQQRDSVIEETIDVIQNFMTHIDDGFCADMMTFIDILNKYKNEDKEDV